MDQAEIENWCKKHNILDIYQLKNNVLTIIINNFCFEIKYPETKKSFYSVSCKDGYLEWLDFINIKIIMKNIKLEEIMDLLEIYSKSVKSGKKEYVSLCDDKKIDIDCYDLDFYRKREQIINMKKVMSYLDNKMVEYFMNTWKDFRNNDKIKLDILTNDIYNWNIKIYGFNNKELGEDLKKLNQKYGYGYIEFEIHHHSILYPDYPPILRILRPKLGNQLMHKISNTKMVNLNYWNSERNTTFIINKVYKILEKHCAIDLDSEENDISKYSTGACSMLEHYLITLASITSTVDDDLDDQKYDNNTLDVDSSSVILRERDEFATKLLNNIVKELKVIDDKKSDTIEKSLLIDFIAASLQVSDVTGISDRIEFYTAIFVLLKRLVDLGKFKMQL